MIHNDDYIYYLMDQWQNQVRYSVFFIVLKPLKDNKNRLFMYFLIKHFNFLGVKSKTVQLVFVASPLSMQH